MVGLACQRTPETRHCLLGKRTVHVITRTCTTQDMKAGGICSLSFPPRGNLKNSPSGRAREFAEPHFLVTTTENNIIKVPTSSFNSNDEHDRRVSSAHSRLMYPAIAEAVKLPANVCTCIQAMKEGPLTRAIVSYTSYSEDTLNSVLSSAPLMAVSLRPALGPCLTFVMRIRLCQVLDG